MPAATVPPRRDKDRGKREWWVIVRVTSLQATFREQLAGLGHASDAERLRLALMGARAAAFDWTLADDQIHWDGASWAIHGEIERFAAGSDFCSWLPAQARARLLNALDETHPEEATFRLEFETASASSCHWFELCGVRIPGPEGRAERVTGMLREICLILQPVTS